MNTAETKTAGKFTTLQQLRRHAWVVGIPLLALVSVYALNARPPQAVVRVDGAVLVVSITLLLVLLNGLATLLVTRMYGGSESGTYRSALLVTSTGSLCNALGGIPVGTAMRLAYWKSAGRLSIRQLAGVTANIALISAWLTATIATVTAWRIELIPDSSAHGGFAALALTLLWIAIRLRAMPRGRRLALVCILVASASLHLTNFVVAGTYALSIGPPADTLLAGALALLGLTVTSTASVGGAYEVFSAIFSRLTALSASAAILAALLLRAAAIVTTSLVAGALLLAGPSRDRDHGTHQAPRDRA